MVLFKKLKEYEQHLNKYNQKTKHKIKYYFQSFLDKNDFYIYFIIHAKLTITLK